METSRISRKSPLSPANTGNGKKMVVTHKLKFDFNAGLFPKQHSYSHHGHKVHSKRHGDKHKHPQSLKMLFNRDPLDLFQLCDKPESSESPETTSPVLDRSHEFEPSNLHPIDVKDPLNLNCIQDEEIQQKLPRKRRRRKRRNTSTANDDEPSVVLNNSSILDDSDVLVSPAEEKVITNLIESDKTDKVISPKNKNFLSPGGTDNEKGFGRLRLKSEKSMNISCSKQESNIRFNDKNKKYKYGNYYHCSYSNQYRMNSEDQRLKSFKKEWFEHQHCLDIGCNTGRVTCWIAKQFEPQQITGIDIDFGLIRIAKRTIAKSQHLSKNGQHFPLSFGLTYGPVAPANLKSNADNKFPRNLSFIVANYVPVSDAILQHVIPEYDVILCLSVTKWVQLNFGDVALKRMFKKIFLQLKPGGRLLLEPQTYASYKKRKNLTPDTRKHFDAMRFMPAEFVKYLLSNEIGFARSECLSYSNQKKGYDRPLYLLMKSGLAEKT